MSDFDCWGCWPCFPKKSSLTNLKIPTNPAYEKNNLKSQEKSSANKVLNKQTSKSDNRYQQTIKNVDLISPQSTLQINQIREEWQDQYPKVLFLGRAGVGKTQLFNQIKDTVNQQIDCNLNKDESPFQELLIQQEQGQNFVVVDTPAFEMDNDIQQREETIENFQKYFDKELKTISTFAIVVNFERTDLMKQKVTDVYKYFGKFKGMITIIVVDCQLSDNFNQDKMHLQSNALIFCVNC